MGGLGRAAPSSQAVTRAGWRGQGSWREAAPAAPSPSCVPPGSCLGGSVWVVGAVPVSGIGVNFYSAKMRTSRRQGWLGVEGMWHMAPNPGAAPSP